MDKFDKDTYTHTYYKYTAATNRTKNMLVVIYNKSHQP